MNLNPTGHYKRKQPYCTVELLRSIHLIHSVLGILLLLEDDKGKAGWVFSNPHLQDFTKLVKLLLYSVLVRPST